LNVTVTPASVTLVSKSLVTGCFIGDCPLASVVLSEQRLLRRPKLGSVAAVAENVQGHHDRGVTEKRLRNGAKINLGAGLRATALANCVLDLTQVL
jgi:hypothetical protein